MSTAALVRRLSALARAGSGPPRARDAWLVFAVALAVRVPLVAFAATRFPPADDGQFYQVVAARIAAGLGYTWLWPDGVVTYAAHYPVGYPALLGAFYAVFGPHAGVAMAVNALLGAAAAAAAHALAASIGSRRGALFAGGFAALVPGLLLYTPALMTEAVAGELALIAAALASSARPRFWLRALLTGLVAGFALLVRPQLVLLLPVLGLLLAYRAAGARERVRAALFVTAVAIGVCLPWTARNCRRLDACAVVSANGGWNLYIGSSPLGRGGFAPIEAIGVPEECKTVFGEAGKDRCFGRAGLRAIAAEPLGWVLLVPKKLGMTFDYGTASAHYLSTSNPALAGERVKLGIGALELVGQRLLLLAALGAAARAAGPGRRARRVLAVAGGVLALTPSGFLGWLALAAALAALGRALLANPPALFALASVLGTAATHAVFFGASRYALVCLPALAALSGGLWPRSERLDTSERGAGY